VQRTTQVERLGFQRGALLDALRGRHQSKAAVAYYLLLDSRRRTLGSGAYLRAELSSACEALTQNPLGERPCSCDILVRCLRGPSQRTRQ